MATPIIDNLTVHTKAGSLKGVPEEGTIAFHRVPYAQPPVGPLRFKAPRPMSWEGIRQTQHVGPGSYQMSSSNQEQLQKLAQSIGPNAPGEYPMPPGSLPPYDHPDSSEDCLYLEIWVPKGKRENMTTFVYYHGGANMMSSGGNRMERPTKFCAENNMIVVRPTYRLGALGWVHFGLISDQLPEAVNLGLQDQILALQWIHDNIEFFGGDRDNLTIGGESCGATATAHLLTYPPTQPLIRRAIMQSLSPYNNWCTQDKPDAVTVAKMYLELLEINDPAELQTIDPIKLLATHQVLVRLFPPDWAMAWRPLGAVVDGNFVPDHPTQYLGRERYPHPHFELLLGTAKDEWTLYRGQTKTARQGSIADAAAAISRVFGPDSEDVMRKFQTLYPDRTPGHLYCDVMGMVMFQYATLDIARNMTKHGVPVYLFQFSYDSPGVDGSLRALHTGDMLFQWGNHSQEEIDTWPAWHGLVPDDVRSQSKEFRELYASFIRYGNPGTKWKRFDDSEHAALWFGKHIGTQKDLFQRKEEIFWEAGIHSQNDLEARLTKSLRDALTETNMADIKSGRKL
ncbi:Para-nitrobenzyl esterase [Penicillium rolfsii]|nr:Para-nitrobenzyl esterase [Penicillium rolfsii]